MFLDTHLEEWLKAVKICETFNYKIKMVSKNKVLLTDSTGKNIAEFPLQIGLSEKIEEMIKNNE